MTIYSNHYYMYHDHLWSSTCLIMPSIINDVWVMPKLCLNNAGMMSKLYMNSNPHPQIKTIRAYNLIFTNWLKNKVNYYRLSSQPKKIHSKKMLETCWNLQGFFLHCFTTPDPVSKLNWRLNWVILSPVEFNTRGRFLGIWAITDWAVNSPVRTDRLPRPQRKASVAVLAQQFLILQQ